MSHSLVWLLAGSSFCGNAVLGFHPMIPDKSELTSWVRRGSVLVVRRRLRVMISWQGRTVRVQARYVPRFLWTTASIDVFLGDQCILRTGGQLKLTGSYATSFRDGGSEHQVELSWGHSSNFHFPYQLRIDGAIVDDSQVHVENWYMIGIPSIIIVALMFLFFGFVFWLLVTLFNHAL
jgi:hypothetical protein